MSNKKYKVTPTSFELFGVECGKGWYGLLQPIIDYINEYNKTIEKEEDKLVPLQIKEKFGGLRIYMNYSTEELNKMINKAEDESYHVCEMCGSKKHIGYTMGYIQTICLDCVKKLSKRDERTYFWRDNADNMVYEIDEKGNKKKAEKYTEY